MLIGLLGRNVGTSDHATICLFVVVEFWEHLYNYLQYITMIIMRL